MWSMPVAIYRYEGLTNGMFHEARLRLRPIMMSYAADWPKLPLERATHSRIGDDF